MATLINTNPMSGDAVKTNHDEGSVGYSSKYQGKSIGSVHVSDALLTRGYVILRLNVEGGQTTSSGWGDSKFALIPVDNKVFTSLDEKYRKSILSTIKFPPYPYEYAEITNGAILLKDGSLSVMPGDTWYLGSIEYTELEEEEVLKRQEKSYVHPNSIEYPTNPIYGHKTKNNHRAELVGQTPQEKKIISCGDVFIDDTACSNYVLVCVKEGTIGGDEVHLTITPYNFNGKTYTELVSGDTSEILSKVKFPPFSYVKFVATSTDNVFTSTTYKTTLLKTAPVDGNFRYIGSIDYSVAPEEEIYRIQGGQAPTPPPKPVEGIHANNDDIVRIKSITFDDCESVSVSNIKLNGVNEEECSMKLLDCCFADVSCVSFDKFNTGKAKTALELNNSRASITGCFFGDYNSCITPDNKTYAWVFDNEFSFVDTVRANDEGDFHVHDNLYRDVADEEDGIR